MRIYRYLHSQYCPCNFREFSNSLEYIPKPPKSRNLIIRTASKGTSCADHHSVSGITYECVQEKTPTVLGTLGLQKSIAGGENCC
jgi:hypothetical protein